MSAQPEYYFNLTTREVEEGRVSSGDERMGPYPTREAAANALQSAEKRNEKWDAADREWEKG